MQCGGLVMLANHTLQWTGPASNVVVNSKSVGAGPAIERRSVMQHEQPPSPSSAVSPDEERARHQRKTMRIVMSFLAIIGGLVFVVFFREWNINGIYAPYLGYVLIGIVPNRLCTDSMYFPSM